MAAARHRTRRPAPPPVASPPAAPSSGAPRSRRRTTLAVAVALGLATSTTAAALPAAPDAADVKVTDALDAALADGDPTTFWVTVAGHADLAPAEDLDLKAARSAYVRSALVAAADRTQDDVRDLLAQHDAEFAPFWIANVIRVTGDRALVDALAAHPDVVRLEPDVAPPDTEPAPAPPATTSATASATTTAAAPPADPAAQVDGITWNVRRIHADRVWQEHGVRGEGVVVATIDSGVQFDHPALLRSYRGYHADGHVTHDYSWFDASGECGGVPCDDSGHGTHVMGIQVGESPDGAYRTGVAPGATWIAARAGGFDDKLAAGQWMLAPTDRDGLHPRPDLAPDVINNSWRYTVPGFYADMLAAWVAAGIFPTFGAGNDGTSRPCSTVAWPTSLADAYAVGNTDVDDAVNASSSRGPTTDGRVKPDASAPGTDILSTSWTGGYELQTGSSQAAPAVAGAVALLWSAAPELDGDVAATRALLDATARPIERLECGGTVQHNNVAGHGLVDVLAAVEAAPRDGLGGVRAVVREAGSRHGVADATVVLTGPRTKVLTTGADGTVRLDRVLPGTYDVQVDAFGFARTTGRVTVRAGATPTVTLAARRVPSGTVTGVVRGLDGGPVAGAAVAVVGATSRVLTGADGRYRVTVPRGAAELDVTTTDRCTVPTRRAVDVTRHATLDVTLDPRTDATGHTCTTTGEYRTGEEPVALAGEAGAATQVRLPFPVTLYGRTSTSVWVAADGTLGFDGAPRRDWSDPVVTSSWREPLPWFDPDTAVYAFHSLVEVDARAAVVTAASDDAFVVEWRDVLVLQQGSGAPAGRLSVSVTLHRDGRFTFAYRDVDPGPWTAGRNATIGLSDAVTWDAFVYGNLEPVVTDGLAITITPPTTPPTP